MRSCLIALGAMLMLPGPAAAQADAADERPVSDAFEQVLDAIEGGVSEEAVLASSTRALEAGLRLDPLLAPLERRYPGSITAMRDAAAPTLLRYTKRVRAEFRPRFVALLRERLTADEALEIKGFYDSPMGRRLVTATVRNYQAEAATAARAEGDEVTPAQVREDTAAAIEGAFGSLSGAEMAELARESASRPALLKLLPLRGEISQLRALMEAQPMDAAENRMLRSAIEAALEAHVKRF